MKIYSFTLFNKKAGGNFQMSFVGVDLLDAIKNLKISIKDVEILSIIKIS